MSTIKNITIILLVFVNLFAFGEETPWTVPKEKESFSAPMMFTIDMKEAGENIYMKNCKSCHGDISKNNMIPLNPLPKDLSTVDTQTDGSFYYKIKNGRGAMPTFNNTLSTSDRWNVIAYIRSFHKNYVQPKPRKAVIFGGSTVKLALEYITDTKQFKITALGNENEKEVPAECVEIALFTKRYFGNLKLADNKTTNKDGVALFNLPKKIPADTAGVLKIIAKVVDTDKYGETIVKKEIKAGVPTNKPSLTKNRAMWNIGSKAPLWIAFTYPITLLGVLGTIGYILLLLRRIYILGKKE